METQNQLPWKTEKEFYDLHAHKFFKKDTFYHVNMIGKNEEEYAKYLIDLLNLRNTSKVIDLGCGSGYLTHKISEISNCIGISTSEECIKYAKKNYPNCNFEVGNMENYLSQNTSHFLSLETIGYSNIETTLKNVFDNLIDGGIFYIKDISFVSNPNEEEQENLKYWTNYWKYKTYTVSEMVNKAYEIGFKLNSFRDLRLDSRLNIKSFMETLKDNMIPEEYPYPDSPVHIGTEFIFQKKKREKWVNPYI